MPEKPKEIYRVMPYNAEAEQALLGSILIDDRTADQLVPNLRENDFYVSANRIVFAAMRELQDASSVVDTVSVADKLMMQGNLDKVGGIDYLASLAECVPSAAGGDHYADIVKRDSLIRKVITAGNNIVKEGYKSVSGTDALITDFPILDQLSHGLKPGELILVAARPSVGKTAFALNIAANVCLKHNKTVAIFSLEMPAHLLVKRMLAHVSGCSLTAMDTTGGLSAANAGKVYDAYRRLLGTNLYIDDYSMNSPTDVLSKCRRLKRDHGLDLIIIDYLQLMTAGGAEESRQVEVSSMSRSMKIYAKELGVPIILLSQMSRGVEQRNDHTPKLSDLRESGAIEQDADMVMFLHRESQFNPAIPENVVKLIVAKNRNGARGEADLEWNGETTSFREYKQGEAPAAPAAPPRPEYRAEESAAEEEDEDETFTDEVTSEDNGLMPFAKAAEDEVPFDLEEEGDDDAEEFADKEYADEYADTPSAPSDEDEDEDEEDEFVDDLDDNLDDDDAFEEGSPEDGELPF